MARSGRTKQPTGIMDNITIEHTGYKYVNRLEEVCAGVAARAGLTCVESNRIHSPFSSFTQAAAVPEDPPGMSAATRHDAIWVCFLEVHSLEDPLKRFERLYQLLGWSGLD